MNDDKPAKLIEPQNQCDGCARGLPTSNGLHQLPDGRPFIGCSKKLYGKAREKERENEQADFADTEYDVGN